MTSESTCPICGGADMDCNYNEQQNLKASATAGWHGKPVRIDGYDKVRQFDMIEAEGRGYNKALREVRDALNEEADGEGRIWADVLDHWWSPGGKFEVKDE